MEEKNASCNSFHLVQKMPLQKMIPSVLGQKHRVASLIITHLIV